MKQPQFGKNPSKKQQKEFANSANFKNGKFNNLVEKPMLAEGFSIPGELCDFIFKSYPRREPKDTIPHVQTDLNSFSPDENVMVWFGHSSVFIQLDGKKILIDPVFSGSASPLPGSVKAFPGSNSYQVKDMPVIDLLLISHDHYDHLDYKTIKKLNQKVKKVICGLGVGSHFKFWGYDENKIQEANWNEKIEISDKYFVHTETAHHSSGRGLARDKTLWMSYVIESPNMKIYYSGDGGYGDHFKEIGKKHPDIDLTLMECGQYDPAWRYIHKLPEEVMLATVDVGAKKLLPVHHSKFTLGKHPWDEPLKKITEYSDGKNYELLTPKIGEVVYLNQENQNFEKWWQGLD